MYQYSNNCTFKLGDEMPASNGVEDTVFKSRKYTIEDNIYHVFFVSADSLPCGAWGHAYKFRGHAKVLDTLPKRVKDFVTQHELYHLRDKHTWGGVFGSELRANIIPGFSDPFGLIATIWATITNKERILFYLDRIKNGH